MVKEPSDIRVVKVKRATGRETETQLLEGHGLAVTMNDDGSVCLEVYPDSARADGLRVYIGAHSASAVAPQWAAWSRLKAWLTTKAAA